MIKGNRAERNNVVNEYEAIQNNVESQANH